jgi:Uma2 family endonuclease
MAIEFQTDPEYIEWLDGVAYPKVSPKRTHARLQVELVRIFSKVAPQYGELGTEWRSYLARGAGKTTQLQPDLSFFSFQRFEKLTDAQAEKTPFSPDVAVEIRSPGDKLGVLSRKIKRYLTTGAVLVLDVDPETRSIVAHAADRVRTYNVNDAFTHPAVPWLTFDVGALFAILDRKR